MNQSVPLSMGKRFFQIQPLNNITSYEFGSGQDVIRFLVPAQANTILDDVVFSGTLQLDTAANTPYQKTDITDATGTTKEFSMDSVAAAHSLFQKVEVFSRRGNLLLESNQFYDQTAKLKEASYHSASDLNVGIPNVMNIQSATSAGTMSRLTREATGDGVPVAFRFDLGMLSDAKQKVNLEAVGGLEIIVHLSSTKNALFNLNNANTVKLDDNASISLKNVELFGRYMMVNPSMAGRFNKLEFTEISNNLQIIQSSRDVVGYSPQVQELDNVIMVAQPNSDTRNNFESDGQATNQLVGQKKYKTAKNGIAFPYNWGFIETKTAAPDITATADISTGYNLGNAEPTWHNCVAIQDEYPPYHSCISAEAQFLAEKDRNKTDKANFITRNLQPISVSYKYGFDDYSTNFQQDLLQIEVESSVKTSDPHIDTTIKNQTQTFNNFYKYHAELNYANLMVSK
tara:strand:+ start:3011 stop:4381 length:1371 start_codon:yes stop_codon:yes gene_type:complete